MNAVPLSPCDTLIRAGTLVTQDGQRRVLTDAGLAVKDGLVAAVGPWAELAATPSRRTLDLSADIVLPGLVNAHTHAPMTVFRGLEDDLPLMEWLTEHIWPAEGRLSEEIVAMGTALACAEMLASGTTAFCDMYLFEQTIAATASDIGIRAVLGEGVFDTPNPSTPSQERAFEKVDELIAFCASRPLLRPCLVAHSVYATNHPALLRLDRIARDNGLTLTLHAAETATETALCLERFGKRPIAVLEELGLTRPGLLVAHAVDVTREEIELMAAKGVAVAHNPRSNMKLASGMAPVRAMRAAGVTVGLGTDGAASNNALNMFAEMGAAALMSKVREMDPTSLPAQAVLDMATVDSAKAVGWPELGSLAPGSPADLTALCGGLPHLQPLNNPVSHLAYAANGGDVRLTMVAGETLYEDGRFTSFDYPALLKEMDSVRKWLAGA